MLDPFPYNLSLLVLTLTSLALGFYLGYIYGDYKGFSKALEMVEEAKQKFKKEKP